MGTKYMIYRYNNQNNLPVFELFKIVHFLSFLLSITVDKNFLVKSLQM